MAHEPLTEEQASAVYDLLIEHAGEQEDEYSRGSFIHSQTTRFVEEYRFIGALGFGGKFRRSSSKPYGYVDCYSEDRTPKRTAMIEATNAALKELT